MARESCAINVWVDAYYFYAHTCVYALLYSDSHLEKHASLVEICKFVQLT